MCAPKTILPVTRASFFLGAENAAVGDTAASSDMAQTFNSVATVITIVLGSVAVGLCLAFYL